MKFIELKEHEPLEIIEATNSFGTELIQMRIFTDGEIEKEGKETTQPIKEYYIGKKKYQYSLNTLKSKNIYFKNHSYVITYLIASEFRDLGNICGWFDVIKDISIYLKNPKDKKALKCAKQAIKEIANHNSSVDSSSLYAMAFSQGKGLQKFETEIISKNVYSLKRQSR